MVWIIRMPPPPKKKNRKKHKKTFALIYNQEYHAQLATFFDKAPQWPHQNELTQNSSGYYF